MQNMGRCVAINCKEIGVYKFPSNDKLRRKWEKALRRTNFKSSDFSRLCKKHFKESDFETTSKTTGFLLQRKFLKKCAIPSIFSWNETLSGLSARTERLLRRNARSCLLPSTTSSSNDLLPSITSSPDVYSAFPFIPDIGQEVQIKLRQEYNVIKQEEKESIIEETISGNSQSQATQTPRYLRIFPTEDFLIDNQLVLFYTGLETYEKFKMVLSMLCPMAYHLEYKGSQVINIGIEDQFLIMLLKLRHNKTNFELSKWFGVSQTVVSNIFITWLNFTYDLWSLLDIWPERELVDCYMPTRFKIYHAKTKIIIDGTEIPIVKPKNLISQQATFSLYKNKNTLKFLVGATPGGLFSYCSEAYGGSTSDRQMMERSDLIGKCESGDSIIYMHSIAA